MDKKLGYFHNCADLCWFAGCVVFLYLLLLGLWLAVSFIFERL